MASHEEYLLGFLKLTGLSPKELQIRASEPEILGNILDYFLQNEKNLIEFCTAENIDPHDIARCRRALPGSQVY